MLNSLDNPLDLRRHYGIRGGSDQMKHDNVEYRGDLRNDDEDDETLSSSSAVKQVMGGGDNLNRQLTSLKDQNKETKTPPQSIACQSRASVSLSKSWREVTAHCTSYDGGKIVMCHGRGTRNLYGIKPGAVKNSLVDNAVKKSGVNIDHHTDGKIDTQVEHQENHTERTYVPFFVAMCEGDLVLIDATRGVKARSIRRGVAISAGAEVALQNKYEDDYDENDADAITCFALSHNDVDLVISSRNTVLRHYDISGSSASYEGDDLTGPARVKRILGKSHDLPVRCMEMHHSGVFFATGSVNGSSKVWDLRGGYATHSFARAGAGGVSALAWAPNATRIVLAIGMDSGLITLNDLQNSAALIELRDHVSSVTCLKWTPTGDLFFSAGRDAVINTWSIEEESFHRNKKHGGSNKKRRAKKPKVQPGFKAVYRRVGTIPIYEQVEGMHVIHSHEYGNKAVLIATAGSKGQLRLWKGLRGEVTQGELPIGNLDCICVESELSCFGEQRGGYTRLQSSNNSDEVVVVDAEHNISVMRSSDLFLIKTVVGYNDEVLDVKMVPSLCDQSRHSVSEDIDLKFVVATNSAQVRIFDTNSFSCDVLHGHTDTVLSVDVSPCGRFVATCGKDKSLRLWHIKSLSCIGIATGHTEAVGACSFSQKASVYDVNVKTSKSGGGAFACTASRDRTLKRWILPSANELLVYAQKEQVFTLQTMKSVRAHEKDINIISVAPNDSFIATGSQDRTVKLWRSTDLSLHGTLKGHRRGVWDCQFSPHDKVLATASGDQTVKMWSLNDFSCVRTFQGHAASVLRVRFLAGGLQLLSSGGDGLVKLWTVRSNECETTLDGHSDKVWAMDVAQGMKTFVSGGADSRIVVWSDITEQSESAIRETQEKNLLAEERLADHVRHKDYEKALELALQLNKPMQVLNVLTTLIERDNEKGQDGLTILKSHVRMWPISQTTKVLRYCRDWNTRARNSRVAMLVVRAIFGAIPASTLARADGVPEILAGIAPYAERHFERLDRMYASSYILDYTLLSMGKLVCNDDEAAWEAKEKLIRPCRVKQRESESELQGAKKGNDSTSEEDVQTTGDSSSDCESDDGVDHTAS